MALDSFTIFLSILYGIALKGVDECIDLKITSYPLLSSTLQGFMFLLQGILGVEDATFNLTTFVSLSTSYFFGGIDDTIWYSFWILSACMLLSTYSSIEFHWELIGFLIATSFFTGFEALLFPEENSFFKVLWSAGTAMCYLVAASALPIFTEWIQYQDAYYKILYFCFGYFLLRTIVKGFLLFTPKPKTS